MEAMGKLQGTKESDEVAKMASLIISAQRPKYAGEVEEKDELGRMESLSISAQTPRYVHSLNEYSFRADQLVKTMTLRPLLTFYFPYRSNCH